MVEFKPKVWMHCPLCNKPSPMPDPDAREWVGIPEEDLKQGDESFFVAWREGARWADAYLKEKNNG